MFFKEEKFFSRRPHPASFCCSILLAGVALCVNLIVPVGDKSHLAWLFLDVFVSSRLAGKEVISNIFLFPVPLYSSFLLLAASVVLII